MIFLMEQISCEEDFQFAEAHDKGTRRMDSQIGKAAEDQRSFSSFVRFATFVAMVAG